MLWVAGEVTESWLRTKKQRSSLLDLFPTDSATMQQLGLLCPGEYLRLLFLLCNRCAETKKYGPKKAQIKAPQKIQLSDEEEIANLLDAQFKTL